MKVGEFITLTRESSVASTNYDVYLVKLENLALVDITRDHPPAGKFGAPMAKHFLFQAIKEGKAEVQFARYA